MHQIADVIVDVPVLQTNIPFEFKIPKKFQEDIAIGMRVIVPFGNGDRRVQGFITNLKDTADFQGELKEISALMDLAPVLNQELIDLGEWMAKTTYSFRISCYQTMLPAVLRARYQKAVKLIDEVEDEELFNIFRGKNWMSWEDVEDRDLISQMLRLKKENKVEVNYIVNDKVTKKTKKVVSRNLPANQLKEIYEKIDGRAHRQKQLVELLLHLPDDSTIDQKTLNHTHNISTSVINRGVEEGWCTVEEVEIYRDPYEKSEIETTEPLKLNIEQQKAYDKINHSIQKDEHEVFLLQGVTGSGKTEVYLQTIAEVLEKGEGALVLVPEIALTPQMVHRFKGRFGELVAVLHSGLSDGEKYDEWRKIEKGEAKVVVGARSSVFAPLDKIGLIVIDEEHEATYKQSESPRYHARDVAIWRAQQHNSPVILGSATPSLESRARASKNVYQLLELKERVNNRPLPQVKVIDMRDEMREGNSSLFSTPLQEALKDRLENNEQSVLMLNRRGYSSFMMCRDCGFVLKCPNCDISQTLHMDTQSMKCHYCGHEEGIPNHCPACHSHKIRYFGTGTQKVEEELNELLPEAKILRMDVDTTRKKGAHEQILQQFGSQEADILLGTQMIAKGLDFPNVTFVGVLNADTALGLPDFRSAEKTFQLLTQVSGRAGRGEIKGDVVIQTYNPEHYAIQLAQTHDYDNFYLREMKYRHLSDYSPYYFLTSIQVSHENEVTAAKRIQQVAEFIKPYLSEKAILLGPTPRFVARTHNKYHFQIIIKYKNEARLNECLHNLLNNTQKEQAQGLTIKIDPQPNQFL
ncbi:MAG TPA: primosomal protein N' [Atopostipes sp.]|nr:primosomal protein N' [Atopostipes sp.]